MGYKLELYICQPHFKLDNSYENDFFGQSRLGRKEVLGIICQINSLNLDLLTKFEIFEIFNDFNTRNLVLLLLQLTEFAGTGQTQ